MLTFGVLKSGCVLSFCIIPQGTHRFPPPPPLNINTNRPSPIMRVTQHMRSYMFRRFWQNSFLSLMKYFQNWHRNLAKKWDFLNFWEDGLKEREDQNLILSGRFGDSLTGRFLPYPGGWAYIYRYTHIIWDAEAKRSSLILSHLLP